MASSRKLLANITDTDILEFALNLEYLEVRVCCRCFWPSHHLTGVAALVCGHFLGCTVLCWVISRCASALMSLFL